MIQFKTNKNLFLMPLIFFWIILSFAWPYYLINSGSHMFFKLFVKYLMIFQPISTLGLAYFFTGGNLREIKNKIKPIIASTSILIVLAFSMMQWMSTLNNYGQYGTYIKNSHDYTSNFLIKYGGDTNFEKETIMRENYEYKYHITFQKIWIFDFMILAGTFLLLYSLDKKESK